MRFLHVIIILILVQRIIVALDYITMYTIKCMYGNVLFSVTDYCPRFNSVVSSVRYMPVCSISSEVPCSCEEDDLFEPSDCCTMDGKQDRSGVCNGEGEKCFTLQL